MFKLDDVEVPSSWSQVASDVIAQKYFRKAGVEHDVLNGNDYEFAFMETEFLER